MERSTSRVDMVRAKHGKTTPSNLDPATPYVSWDQPITLIILVFGGIVVVD